MKKMKTRVLAVLAALTCVIGFQVLTPPSALADQATTKCTSNNAVCMTVIYQNHVGDVGFQITTIALSCDPNHWSFGWDQPAVDGHSLGIYRNPGHQLKHSWSDANANVDLRDGDGACDRIQPVNTDYPTADTMTVEWVFTEQRNLQSDIDGSLTITLKDAND